MGTENMTVPARKRGRPREYTEAHRTTVLLLAQDPDKKLSDIAREANVSYIYAQRVCAEAKQKAPGSAEGLPENDSSTTNEHRTSGVEPCAKAEHERLEDVGN